MQVSDDKLADLNETLRVYMDHVKSGAIDGKLCEYNQGMLNGLEVALAYLEDRPVFFIDQDSKYDPYDLERFPEYFL